jgi:large subunit ribosomal protein L15
MASRFKKVRRQRGSRTHGWGQIGQHRHSGSRGGTGMAGMHKHKWSYTVKYAPDHFGHNAMPRPNRVETTRWLNLIDLAAIAANAGNGKTLDLSALGYDKLLGRGSVDQAYVITVPRASSSAIEKVKAAGGSVSQTEPVEPKEKAPKEAPPKKK